MKENEVNFLCDFFKLIAKYKVSFGASECPTHIYVDGMKIADIIENDCITTININVDVESYD